MQYRKEIDGLRALAVLPVIFFHAGFEIFSGGFVGVDIFFVISGYLITTIITDDLEQKKFLVLNFYERRARRILPALFVVMSISSAFAYFWMMPDEFKNFGQSLVATTIFSNNILLALTSGYWELASEFKPLLHTWSLGVEEQYYVIFPFLLTCAWKYFKTHLQVLMILILILSLTLANFGIASSNPKMPVMTFYLLPTRAWEIVIGALVAFHLKSERVNLDNKTKNQILSCAGFLLISFSIFIFNKNYPSPSFYTLIPTLGAALIILFATKDTLVNRLLSQRIIVGVGLISYSLYLWHQPVFAFSRIYLVNKPSLALNTILIVLALILAYLTHKYIEAPFRNNKTVSQKIIIRLSLLFSVIFILFGIYLNKSYGMAYRVFDSAIKVSDMDKRSYNHKVFEFKKDKFTFIEKRKILVIGNSFARDFINMTNETFDTTNVEIVYRDDFSECFLPFKSSLEENLLESADVIILASGGFSKNCTVKDISFVTSQHKKIFYIGTKHFGSNLNWLKRLDSKNRPNQYNPLLPATIKEEQEMSQAIPAENFISLIHTIYKNGQIPVTDSNGRMLSTDRAHLTKYGAIFFGSHVLSKSPYADFFSNK